MATRVYTRGGPLSGLGEALSVAAANPRTQFWKSDDGTWWTLERIEDSHLQNIERYLMGKGRRELDASWMAPGKAEAKLVHIRSEMMRRMLPSLVYEFDDSDAVGTRVTPITGPDE